jgi:SRSO17 transposase
MTAVVEIRQPETGLALVPAGAGVVWPEAFAELFATVAGEFAQAPSRRRARGYLLGLLSHSERKNGWTIAEFAGDAGPEGMQRLLNFYAWDEDKVRDALRRFVVRAFGHPAGVLAADETGFLKKGRRSAGVQRQYSGTAGRVENCQLGVFLAYAAPDGSRALIDRELYLPESWTGDRGRCREAGIGDDVEFATKPELARKMVERAVTAGVPFSWFTADEAYGQNPGLRDWLEEQQIAYVMAVPVSEPCATAAGKIRADGLAARVPASGWQVLSCGDGSKGPRLYEWALIGLAGPGHQLLVRRALAPNAKGELELAFFRCCAPPRTTLTELVAVAGARWAIEIRHLWCRSTRVVLSLLCSLSFGGLGPAGAAVEACRAGSSLAELAHLRGVCGDDPVLAAGGVLGGDPAAVDPVVDAGGGHAQGGGQAGDRPFAGCQVC